MNRDFNKFKRLNDLRKNKATTSNTSFPTDNRFGKSVIGKSELTSPSNPETNTEGIKNHINGLFIAHSKAMLKSNDDILNCLQLMANNQSESINFLNDALSNMANTLANINDSVKQLQDILIMITDETDNTINSEEPLNSDYLENNRQIQPFTEEQSQTLKKKK
jgi:hypothetical protein